LAAMGEPQSGKGDAPLIDHFSMAHKEPLVKGKKDWQHDGEKRNIGGGKGKGGGR